MPEELSRNCFDVILQHDWSIEQCLLHIRVFFGGKTKSPCFVLIKQITNTSETIFQGHTKIALTNCFRAREYLQQSELNSAPLYPMSESTAVFNYFSRLGVKIVTCEIRRLNRAFSCKRYPILPVMRETFGQRNCAQIHSV